MDMNKLKSKLTANLNSARSQVDTNAKQTAPQDSGGSSDPLQQQTPVGQSDRLPQEVEQVLPASLADDPVDNLLHPARVWPD